MAYQVNAALLNRLPRTFVPALNEQFRNWDLLFPAERRTISTQMEWLAALPDADFKALFEPIVTLEKQMNLPPWNPATDRLSVTDTGILVRSPHYQQWREQVERTFEKIDAGVAAQGKLKRSNKLIVAVMPAGLASHPGSLWPKLEAEGKWVSLDSAFRRRASGRFTAASPNANRGPRSSRWSAPGCWNTTRNCRQRMSARRSSASRSTNSDRCATSFSCASIM